MKNATVVGLASVWLAAAMMVETPARGQVIAVSVGVQPRCPYGLSVCWPEAREGLVLMKGVQSVDTQPALGTWTGTLRTRDGVLPDPAAWSREFKDIVGGAFGFRGVEVAVEGDLVEDDDGGVALKVPGSRALIRLAPLGRKVQWDPERRCEQAATDAERTAYRRLAARAREAAPGQSPRVRIIGPMDGTAPAERPRVSVRDFAWL